MFFLYLKRELTQRRRQSLLLSIALATAIALVLIVNAASAGINSAQSKVLSGLYGIGTDISISQTALPGNPGSQQFSLGANESDSPRFGGDGTRPTRPDFTAFAQDRLEVARFSSTLNQSSLESIVALSPVSAASATLKLNSITFEGTIQNSDNTDGGQGGFGGGNFNIDQKSIEGVDVQGSIIGPLNQGIVKEGRTFSAADQGKNVTLVDSSYATTNKIQVGDFATFKSTKFEVVGIISAAVGNSATSSNFYIPLDVAQSITNQSGKITNFYISAKSAKDISSLKSELVELFPDATVSTQSDLASSLTGSLASASSLINTLGKWLSIIVLVVAFVFAGLFTSSGITRRIREFGTLKAIGWRNSRITRQILGESFATSAFGALLGLGIGVLGIFIINLVAPSLTSTKSVGAFGGQPPGGFPGGGPGGGGFPGGGPGGGLGQQSASESVVDLHLNFSFSLFFLAIAISVLGGLIAGAMGAMRASAMTPASALRSVA